jgi:hypothetical protein
MQLYIYCTQQVLLQADAPVLCMYTARVMSTRPAAQQLLIRTWTNAVSLRPLPAAPRRPICTLHDLQQVLCAHQRVEHYEVLQLGPLLANPRIIQEFHPAPTVTAIPEVSSCSADTAVLHALGLVQSAAVQSVEKVCSCSAVWHSVQCGTHGCCNGAYSPGSMRTQLLPPLLASRPRDHLHTPRGFHSAICCPAAPCLLQVTAAEVVAVMRQLMTQRRPGPDANGQRAHFEPKDIVAQLAASRGMPALELCVKVSSGLGYYVSQLGSTWNSTRAEVEAIARMAKVGHCALLAPGRWC